MSCSLGRRHSCRTQRPIFIVHAVQQTMVIPLLLLNAVVDAPVMQVVMAFFLPDVVQRLSHGPDCARGQGGRCPCDACGHHDRCRGPDSAGTPSGSVAVAVYLQGHRLPRRGDEASHLDSPAAVLMVVDVPVQRVPQFMAQTAQKTVWEFRRCRSAWWVRSWPG